MSIEGQDGFDNLSKAGGGFFVDENGEVVLNTPALETTETEDEVIPEMIAATEDNSTAEIPADATTEETTEEASTEEEVNPLADLFNVPVFPEEQAKSVEWNLLGSELGIANHAEIKTKEDLQVAIRTEIERHKQIVEPDLSKFGEDAKDFIAKLEQGVEFREALNPIRHLDAFVLASDEYKVSFMLQQEGYSGDKLADKLEELRDEGKIERLAHEHTQLAESLIAQELQEIDKKYSERKQKYIQQEQDRVSSELSQLESTIKGLTEYKGLAIPENYKQYLLSQLKTGQFQSKLNNAQAQVNAYLDLELGAKVAKLNVEKLTEAERSAYNKAKESELNKMHNIPPKPKAGVKAPPVDLANKKRFDSWSIFEA
jgi:hypothetical protein